MTGATVTTILLFSGMLTLSVPPHTNTRGANRIPVVALQAGQGQKTANGGNRTGQKGGRKMGDWLETHKDLPPDQQLKALENDPFFKRLPPQRQNALRERLKKFNSLPPEKRDQALKRMQFLAKLSPQQREELRNASQEIKKLPQDRQVAVHKAVRHLRQMPPDERKQVLESDRFHTTFSDQEQKLIGQLAEINPPGEGGSAQGIQPK
ncbi:MAG TPA: DUF3106 domain-containing protein [Candidatus Angelobacter sp.]|nr:DUF3106 domain-containing protein [Candidatus Angelobacter sp.]